MVFLLNKLVRWYSAFLVSLPDCEMEIDGWKCTVIDRKAKGWEPWHRNLSGMFFFFFTTCRKFKFEIGIQQSNFPLCDSFIIWFLYVIKLQFVTNSFFPSTRITTLMFAALSFFILFFSFLPSFPFLTDICIHPVIYQIAFFQRNKN
jgi:hypothetical protein